MYGLPIVFRQPSGHVPLAMLMNGQFRRYDSEHAQALCTETHRKLIEKWGGSKRVHTYGVARLDEVVERVRSQYRPRMIVRLYNVSTQLHNTLTYLRVFAEFSKKKVVYRNVLVLRYDLYILQMPLDINTSFHVTVPWRETRGHWRRENLHPFKPNWNQSAYPRIGDAFLEVAYDRLSSLIRTFADYVRDNPTVFFMHSMARKLTEVDALRFAVPDGMFDSNPCRATCMLNPIYRILPRDLWLVQRDICSRRSDFVFDPESASICCPSPKHPNRRDDTSYCCPNSVRVCSGSPVLWRQGGP